MDYRAFGIFVELIHTTSVQRANTRKAAHGGSAGKKPFPSLC
jgi:hypothetical protein